MHRVSWTCLGTLSLLITRKNVRAKKHQKIKAISTQRKQWKNSEPKTIYTHTGMLIQNLYDWRHSYNVAIQKGDPWDDSHTVIRGNKEWSHWTWPHIFAKSLLSAAEGKFYIVLVHTENHTYNVLLTKKALISPTCSRLRKLLQAGKQ